MPRARRRGHGGSPHRPPNAPVPRVCLVRSCGGGPTTGVGRFRMAAVRVPRLRWRRRLPSSWAPLPACPALRSRLNPGRPTVAASAVVPSALFTASASAMSAVFVAQSRGLQSSLCTLRSRGRRRTTQHSVPAGQSTSGRSGLLTCRVAEKVPVMNALHAFPSWPSFAWRKTSRSLRSLFPAGRHPGPGVELA